jgi:hypothetical protein
MASKAIKAAAVAAIVAIAGYWYWSPYVAVRQLQSAAQKQDADAFNQHVDYPKLRESLKSQFSTMFADKLAQPADSDNAFAKAGAVLGTMIGMAMANPFIEAMVRPESIMRAMQDGQLTPKVTQPSDAQSVGKPDQQAGGAEPKQDKLKWAYERKDVDKLIAYATASNKPDEKNQKKFGMVLQRSGFADWKLTEVRLPALNK